MRPSLPPERCAVGGIRFSVPARGGSRNFDTGHTPHIARHSAGFTLIELLAVVAVIAILAALALATMGQVQRKGAESRARSEVAALSAAIESYKLEFGNYPASNNLFTELTGQGPVNTNRVLFEPTPQMVDTNTTPHTLVDPWGARYNYSTNPANNIGSFDLWSTANGDNPDSYISN